MPPLDRKGDFQQRGKVRAVAMAVAAAPCEERDGRRGGLRAAPIGEHGRFLARALSVLPLLLADGAFGSRGRPGSDVKSLLGRHTIQRTGWPGRTSNA